MRPRSTDELLHLLRRTRLLDDEPLRRLASAWPGSDDPEPHVEELIRAGLLTRYQGEKLLAGRVRALRLGPYRILDRLGRGGMGLVFKAEHLLLRRLVALKVIGRARPRAPAAPATPRRNTGRKTQLRREVEMVGGLSHPHIVAAHDARRIRGRFVLVLEYIDGIDLERLVAETGPLPVSLAVEVTRQAALALAHLHERRLVHRDVKPSNLILTHAEAVGGAPVVKLLDLGLACPVAQGGDELCGTPDYLAPERGESPAATDIRSDLYSLGCSLYQLLTGRVPFPDGSWTGKLIRHRVEVPEPVQAPPPVAALVERLMARDPAQRFASPAEVVAAIDALPPAGQSAPPVPVTAPGQARLLTQRRRRAAIAALCLVAVALGAGAGNAARKGIALSIAAQPAARSHSPTVEPPRSPSLAVIIETAEDGSVVEVPAGRHVVPPLHLRGKRLTLRGAPGPRPTIVRATNNTWDALLQSDRDLELQHLELQGGEAAGRPAPLVSVESAALIARDCVLTQRGGAPAVAARKSPLVRIERCHVVAQELGVAIEVPPLADSRVSLHGTEIHVRDAVGPAILLWAADASRLLDVELCQSKLRAGRAVACRSLTGPARVRASDSQFVFHQALVSLDSCQDDWRDRFSWHGQRNRCETAGPWLRLNGQPVGARDEEAFAKLWRDPQ